jgi:hypothetical protein
MARRTLHIGSPGMHLPAGTEELGNDGGVRILTG